MGLGASLFIIYAAICYLRQQEKHNPPSRSWFQKWLKRNSSLHTIKTKPIAQVRIATHSEEDLKNFFVEYQNTLSKYGINRAKYIFNIDKSDIRIGCPTGEIVIVPTEVKELYTASPENCKSLTIIETICADGHLPPPPVVICPGEEIMENWIHDNLTGAEVIAVLQTGHTNEKVALAWLTHFIRHAGAGPNKHWRIVLLDGHITHCQDDFIIKCHENHIVPYQFSSHLTHVLQPLDVGVFRPWKHYHNMAIYDTLHSLDMEYTISSFFQDLNTICKKTFQPSTINNSFIESGMFPVLYKKALKKLRCYNKAKCTEKHPQGIISNSKTNQQPGEPSMEKGGLLELPTLSGTYFESQKGMGEWIDRAETFSPNLKARFQQWAKGTQISLTHAELQHQSYHNVQARILKKTKRKSTFRRVIQKGGMITIEVARVRKKEKGGEGAGCCH